MGVIDSDVCCAVGKCVRSSGHGAYAGASNFLSVSGPSMSSQYGYGFDGEGKVDLSLTSKSDANAGASSGSALSLSVAVEAEICTDSKGRGRCYGDSWYEKGQECRVCVCHSAD